MADDEVHSVFPDPEGAKHPDRKTIKTARDLINHVIIQLSDETWEKRSDGWYCMICAPGGYRIRAGADPAWHEEQRLPATHKHNRAWMTVQVFLKNKDTMPLPVWPDCYADVHGHLHCYICRRIVGEYGREHGELHDLEHLEMQHRPMRPSRLQPKIRERARGRRHMIDEILASRREGYDPEAEAAAARGQFGEPAPDPARPPAIPGSFTARPGKTVLERVGHMFADDHIPKGGLILVTDPETQGLKQVTQEHLDEWVEESGQRWRVACEKYANHVGINSPNPCIGQGCECSCHRDADTPYEPPIPPFAQENQP